MTVFHFVSGLPKPSSTQLSALLPEPIHLRFVRQEDLPLLQDIYYSTREGELAQVNWTAEEKSVFLLSQFDLQHRYYQAHFPEAEFHVVQHNDEDIGRLYVDWRHNELRVIDIALLAKWRGQGIGSAILRNLLIIADERCKRILLHVEANSPALSLYVRLGFKEIASNGIYLQLRRQPQALAA